VESSSTRRNGSPDVRIRVNAGQRADTAIDAHRLHPPARGRMLEQPAVGGVVIDDQHRHTFEIGVALGLRRRAAAGRSER